MGVAYQSSQPSFQRTARLRKNQDLLRSLRSQHGARLRLRAEHGPSPLELVKQASLAARLQDLDIICLEAGTVRREPAQWDELRVWDPGTQATGKAATLWLASFPVCCFV